MHSVDDELVDQEFLGLLAANHTIYGPTLVVTRDWSRAMGSIMLGVHYPIDDPGHCVDSITVANIANVEPLKGYLPEDRRKPDLAFRFLERSGARDAVMAENLRRVRAAGGTIVTGTDAGNPLTVHGPSIFKEMEAMQAAGLSAPEIIVMSTRNGTQAMHRLKDFGALEAGELADLLVLAEDPRKDVRAFRSLTQVMRGGRLYGQRLLAQRNEH